MNLFPANWADVPLMSLSLLGPLAMFALVSSITPGPNNVMLASSGLNFGFRRSVPHLLGVNLGFTLMIFLVGIGLGSVFQQVPQLYTVLKYAGAAYLLYLAWKIANSGEMDDGEARGKPFTFLQAAAFHASLEALPSEIAAPKNEGRIRRRAGKGSSVAKRVHEGDHEFSA